MPNRIDDATLQMALIGCAPKMADNDDLFRINHHWLPPSVRFDRGAHFGHGLRSEFARTTGNFGGVGSQLGMPLVHGQVRVGGNVGKRLPRARGPLDFDAVRASALAQSEMYGRLARAGITG